MGLMSKLWIEFCVDKISIKYKFNPVFRNNVTMFEVDATVDEIIEQKQYFIYLAVQQQAILVTRKGLIKLEQNFDLKEFWISISGVVFICKPKGRYKVKNINKLRHYLENKYGKCEVEIEDSN